MSDIRQHRRHLWLVAQEFISTLFMLFGGAEAIAARHTLVRETWRQLAAWVRAGEALMRQLLLIEAALLPKPNTRPMPRKPYARVRKLMEFSADQPDEWRVSFRVFPPTPARGRRSPRRAQTRDMSRDGSAAARFHSAWPLAERVEALMRVFNEPLPYAQRLARRLYAAPRKAGALSRYPEDTPALVGAGFALVCAEADAARRKFNSS